jgi:ubiquinone/menaquinone biosynthesis C-methylase UbiE
MENRLAFDIGCGEGRMIRRMSRIFKRCDGADFSQNMTAAARERCPNSTIWLTRGNDCGDAPSDTYDFVYCTISLQHIASYDIRSSIIKDITRILKPGGKMTLQMLYSAPFPYIRTHMRGVATNGLLPDVMTELFVQNAKDVGWFDNNFAAKGTNSKCDTLFGETQIQDVIKDTKRFFGDVAIWFHDISIGRVDNEGARQLPDTHPNSHLHYAYPGTHFAFIHGIDPRKG